MSLSSSGGQVDSFLNCVANALTCAAIKLCGTGSGSSGSGDVGMDGSAVPGASPDTGTGMGGAGGASGAGGAGGANVTAPVATGGGISGSTAGGTGGAASSSAVGLVGAGGTTVLASAPAGGVQTAGTIGSSSSASTGTGQGTGTSTGDIPVELSKSGGCQIGQGGSGSWLGVLLGLAFLVLRRRRVQ